MSPGLTHFVESIRSEQREHIGRDTAVGKIQATADNLDIRRDRIEQHVRRRA